MTRLCPGGVCRERRGCVGRHTAAVKEPLPFNYGHGGRPLPHVIQTIRPRECDGAVFSVEHGARSRLSPSKSGDRAPHRRQFCQPRLFTYVNFKKLGAPIGIDSCGRLIAYGRLFWRRQRRRRQRVSLGLLPGRSRFLQSAGPVSSSAAIETESPITTFGAKSRQFIPSPPAFGAGRANLSAQRPDGPRTRRPVVRSDRASFCRPSGTHLLRCSGIYCLSASIVGILSD